MTIRDATRQRHMVVEYVGCTSVPMGIFTRQATLMQMKKRDCMESVTLALDIGLGHTLVCFADIQ
jgi:hypothetical protein